MTRSLLALALLTACSPELPEGEEGATPADTDGTEPTVPGEPGDFGGAPVIGEILPMVAVSDGYVYIFGENLADDTGSAAEVTVQMLGDDGRSVAVVFDIVEAFADQLTVHVPADLHVQLPNGGKIEVVTPGGTTQSEGSVYPVENNGFGGAAEPGQGMFGLVFALATGTPSLPNLFDQPCTQPNVIDDDTFACPHTSILVPNLDVPSRSFDQGFPGLGTELVEWFAIGYAGYLEVPTDGNYRFEICSDDGSKFFIDGGSGFQTVIDNDGQHGFSCLTGDIALTAGTVPIAVHYFQGPRYEIGLTLSWTGPGGLSGPIPPENYSLFGPE